MVGGRLSENSGRSDIPLPNAGSFDSVSAPPHSAQDDTVWRMKVQADD
jgi:hypothetical protein